MLGCILLIGSVLCGACLWYVYHAGECVLNGSVRPWHCLREEVSWFLPGGDARKGEYIRKMVSQGNGVICSQHGSWEYESVRKGELYIPCAKDVLPGRINFLFKHLLIPSLPTLIYFVIRFTLSGWFLKGTNHV